VTAGAEDCTLQLASHQIRIHNAHRCALHIRARSNPIIEHSDGLQFTSYTPAYVGCDDQLQAAGLHEDSGLWREVQDFGWLKHSQSPNWYAHACCVPHHAAAVLCIKECRMQHDYPIHACAQNPTTAGNYVTMFTEQGQISQVLHQGLLLLQLLQHDQLPKYAVVGASCQSTVHLDWSAGAARCW
jgi:hypothetical protein